MRTTVTIDPDVEVLLRRAVRDSGVPFKQVLNDAVRNACAARRRGRPNRSSCRWRTWARNSST